MEQGAEVGIGQGQPAPRGNPIGDIGEFIGPKFGEFREQLGAHQVAMQGGDAVDVVAGDRGQVGHAHGLVALLVDDRELGQDWVVARVMELDLGQEAPVDFVDQLQVAGQQAGEEP